MDKDFLQSDEWRKFQESVGRKTYHIESLGGGASKWGLWANVIKHQLPVVGKYFYVPRSPFFCHPELACPVEMTGDSGSNEIPDQVRNDSYVEAGMTELINLAKKENAGWIRIEPASEEILEIISRVKPSDKKGSTLTIKKAPHDMQPREILVMDITKSEEELLAEMKQKTRYNIKVAQKRGVKILVTRNSQPDSQKYLEKFLELVKITAERDKITPHPENYYRKMFEIIPGDILKLYIAEYQNKVIAANIVIHYGNTATYLHGASDNEQRNVMAPYFLQWQAILDAKKAGLIKYDLGGVKLTNNQPASPAGGQLTTNNWQGITRFKTGFSPNTKPTEFPGSYDIVINPFKYNLYRILQKIKSIT